MSDRSFGYGVLLFLTIFLLIPLYYLLPSHRSAGQRKTIIFTKANTLNFLKIQDPVRIYGIVVGEVKNIVWETGNTLVTIEVKPLIELHQGCRVTAEPVGLMGDRCLVIDPGESRAPLIDPNEPVIGQFLDGPVEVIRYADSFRERVAMISGIMRDLREGSGETQPIALHFKDAEKILDSISSSLVLLGSYANDRLGGRIDSLDDFMKNMGQFSRKQTAALPADESQVASVLSKSEECFQTADSLVSTMHSLVARMNPQESTALSATMMTLSRQLSVLQTYSRAIRQSGLNLRVRL